MSPPHIAPPDDEEVDVAPGGTTIAGQTVQGTTTTQISPRAIGPVTSFKLAHSVGGTKTSTDVTGVRIPFGDSTLEVLKLASGSSQWKQGSTVLTAYASRTSRDWPSGLVTPSTRGSNDEITYTTASDPTSKSATWSSITWSDFTAAQIKIQQS